MVLTASYDDQGTATIVNASVPASASACTVSPQLTVSETLTLSPAISDGRSACAGSPRRSIASWQPTDAFGARNATDVDLYCGGAPQKMTVPSAERTEGTVEDNWLVGR
jgi:hypothetical protein